MTDNLFTSFMNFIYANDKDLAQHYCNLITDYFQARRKDLTVWNQLVHDYFKDNYAPKMNIQAALKQEFHKLTSSTQ